MKSSSKQRLRGFTLIELIITLVILGILSVTAVPKFLGSSTEDAYSYRDRALNALRTVQLRAMQNTAMASCHTLYITSTLIAPPTPDTCIGGADANNTDHLVVQIDTQRSDITFNALDSNANIFTQISFDPLGKSNQTCTTQCRIDVGLAGVCISGEGLIYACP
ncbi:MULTISPECIES: type II secretion system protein [unclassified Pseudoalteromonas]|uniref:type II secretion system protein n=1 Tax=unclassified Pseudoalteromonas TaxID=194690 RepID=UPI001408F3D8|nr:MULTISPECIES: type II secretion system protein [unclassified Pseudoalteromonas]MBH0025456.1 type II secretion system protein [Pseudoalteromonas sp. SWN29]MBH0039761.1 type II secretion system protein [Pseudoalteromonas sp. SWN166]